MTPAPLAANTVVATTAPAPGLGTGAVPPTQAEARQLATTTTPPPPARTEAPAAPERAPAAPVAPAASAPTAPAAAAPTEARGAAPPAEVSGPWRNALIAWLNANRTYPDLARRRGEQGTVLIRLTVDRGGRVLDAALARGSGSTVLDEAAVQQYRGKQVPAFPASMTQDKTTLVLPILYRLE